MHKRCIGQRGDILRLQHSQKRGCKQTTTRFDALPRKLITATGRKHDMRVLVSSLETFCYASSSRYMCPESAILVGPEWWRIFYLASDINVVVEFQPLR